MKKLNLILLLLACTKMSMGQLLLTGNIKGAARRDSVEVNLSYDGNYWAKNSVYLKTDAAGNFRITYPYRTQKFIMLISLTQICPL